MRSTRPRSRMSCSRRDAEQRPRAYKESRILSHHSGTQSSAQASQPLRRRLYIRICVTGEKGCSQQLSHNGHPLADNTVGMPFRQMKPATLGSRYAAMLLVVTAAVIVGYPAVLPSAQERENVPTVDVSYPDFTYPSEPCTFTLRHFRNMRTYIWYGHRVRDSGTLRHGKYERKWTPARGYSGAELVWLRVPRSSRPDSELAVVLYSWDWVGGSSSQSDVVQVFGCRDDHLVVLQQISNDAHGLQGGVNYDVRIGVLTIKSVRYGSGAHCCPEKLDIVSFRWTGAKFHRVAWKTVPMPK